MKRGVLLGLIVFLGAGPALAGAGIQGRVAWRGELVPGVKIRAYRAVTDIAAREPVAVSAPTELDGTYRLELPPGTYYLTARDFEGEPQPGKFFCYYSGSPVTVAREGFTNVGFNLIKIPEEAPPQAGSASGIVGEISYRGEPLERVYLYVYKDPQSGFKGPGYFIQPVETGRFRLRLPPGEYWLLARKRARGGRFGPIEVGDYFNYYYGNPVQIEPDRMHEVKIATITRLSMLEDAAEAPAFRGVRGTVRGPRGRPTAGLYVFAYRTPAMTGTPDFFAGPTASDGSFELALPEAGTYHLLAREHFGGPASAGEMYGKYGKTPDHSVTLSSEDRVREVTIHVDPKDDS